VVARLAGMSEEPAVVCPVCKRRFEADEPNISEWRRYTATLTFVSFSLWVVWSLEQDDPDKS
jgi:hypothetical protein